MSREICTYEEVLLDWARAEVLSPGKWKWYKTLGEPFRDRVRANDLDALSQEDRDRLVDAVSQVRGPYLLQPYGISPASMFWRAVASVSELAKFAIIPYFVGEYGPLPLRDLSARITDDPLLAEKPMREEATTMLEIVRAGGTLNGRPIAIALPDPSPPLLIEGYKRSMVAMWNGDETVRMYFCQR